MNPAVRTGKVYKYMMDGTGKRSKILLWTQEEASVDTGRSFIRHRKRLHWTQEKGSLDSGRSFSEHRKRLQWTQEEASVDTGRGFFGHRDKGGRYTTGWISGEWNHNYTGDFRIYSDRRLEQRDGDGDRKC